MYPMMCCTFTMVYAKEPKEIFLLWKVESTPSKKSVVVATKGISWMSGSWSTSLVTKWWV